MESLAYCLINLGVFVAMVTHLPCESSILLNLSSPKGVAILDCESHSKAGSTNLVRCCRPCNDRRNKGRGRGRTWALNMSQDVFLQYSTLFARSSYIPQVDSIFLCNPSDSRSRQHLHISLDWLLLNHLLSLRNLWHLVFKLLFMKLPASLTLSSLLPQHQQGGLLSGRYHQPHSRAWSPPRRTCWWLWHWPCRSAPRRCCQTAPPCCPLSQTTLSLSLLWYPLQCRTGWTGQSLTCQKIIMCESNHDSNQNIPWDGCVQRLLPNKVAHCRRTLHLNLQLKGSNSRWGQINTWVAWRCPPISLCWMVKIWRQQRVCCWKPLHPPYYSATSLNCCTWKEEPWPGASKVARGHCEALSASSPRTAL